MNVMENFRLCSELRVQIGADFTALEEGGMEVVEYHEKLGKELTSVRYARERVNALLEDSDESLKDVAVLLVSEVVTNALLHTDGEVKLVINFVPGWIKVAVVDNSPVAPVVKNALPTSPGGRGMELVDMLSANWGIDLFPGGKSVWFEMGSLDGVEPSPKRRVNIKHIHPKATYSALIHMNDFIQGMLEKDATRATGIDLITSAAILDLENLTEQAANASAEGLEHFDLMVNVPTEAGALAVELLELLELADRHHGLASEDSRVVSEDVISARRILLQEISSQLQEGAVV